jgi:hypothetical protein
MSSRSTTYGDDLSATIDFCGKFPPDFTGLAKISAGGRPSVLAAIGGAKLDLIGTPFDK